MPRFALLSPSAFLSFSALNLTPHTPFSLYPYPLLAARRRYNFGGKWVYFHPTELGGFGKEEDLGKDGLLLLGFKDKEKLK